MMNPTATPICHEKPEPDRRRRHHRARHHHLRAAKAENRPAHFPEHRRPQLQPDDEQHHDHAELRDVHDIAIRGADQPETKRPDHDAREQIAEDRAEPEPFRERDGDDGREQVDERLEKAHAMTVSGFRWE